MLRSVEKRPCFPCALLDRFLPLPRRRPGLNADLAAQCGVHHGKKFARFSDDAAMGRADHPCFVLPQHFSQIGHDRSVVRIP
jgi:hypothetical protein